VVHDLIAARVLLPLLLVLLAAAPAPAGAAPGRDCPGGKRVRCFTVTVPLDRSGRVSGQIRLRAARVRSRNPTRTPVVALVGGPGEAGVTFATAFATQLPRAHRDLIVLDQRGTGASGLLRCRAFERRAGATLDRPAGACGRSLGARRSYYTSADSADDIEALRVRLGTPRIVLYGVSYGTRVALEYARRHPRGLARLILDSSVGLEGPDAFVRETLGALPRVLHRACRRGCGAAGAHPVADLAQLRRRLRREPVRTHLRRRGRSVAVRVTADDLLSLLVSSDLDPGLMRRIPAAVRAALHGREARLARLKAEADSLEGGSVPIRDFSPALFAATTCEESLLPWDPAAAPATRRLQALAALRATAPSALAPFDRAAALREGAFSLCSDWPAPRRVVDPGAPLPPGLPTLILSGELDLRTPLERARQLASALPGAQLVVVGDTGHDVLGARPRGCVRRALTAFLAQRRVPRRCY
jgi:pimeloyl-ACP methyl ester carboxylesterase